MSTLNQSMLGGSGCGRSRPAFIPRESDTRFVDLTQSSLKATQSQSSLTIKTSMDYASRPQLQKGEPLMCIETNNAATIEDERWKISKHEIAPKIDEMRFSSSSLHCSSKSRYSRRSGHKATASDVVEFQPLTPLSLLHDSLLLEEKLSTSTRDESTRDDVDDDEGSGSVPATVDLLVAVSSAVKLDAKQLRLIAKKMQRLTGFRTLRIQNTVDPSLIAGFVVSYGNDESHVIDLSVKGQLLALAARVESFDRTVILNHHQES